MVARDQQRDGEGHRPAHERHGLSRSVESRLAELGRQLPPPTEEERRHIAAERAARLTRRLVAIVAVLLVVVLGALAAVQWFRPVPQPHLEGIGAAIRVPGAAPQIPLPSAGEASLAVGGLRGSVQVRGDQPAPIAGLAGVLTAYVVLKDHPLATGGATGPPVPVTAATLSAMQSGNAAGMPEVTVASGETLSELDALEGLLVDGGADMATLLADWDTGNTATFVARMNRTARSLGLRETHITDPSGVDPGTVSTADDLVRLGEAAMQIPVLRQIASLGEATLPLNGLRYNPDFDLGQDGIVGIAVGSNSTTNGCYLFAAEKTVGPQTATLYGAVLGQSGPDGPDTAAVDAGDAMVRAALAAIAPIPIVPAGHQVATLAAPWGASAAVAVSQPVSALAWPGLDVAATVRRARVTVPVAAGAVLATLTLGVGSDAASAALKTTAPLTGPSGWWRVVR